MNAQGEDVVAGIRTPRPIAELKAETAATRTRETGDGDGRRSRAHYRDMQDVEFTIERGRLYILQTRAGKRTAQAAVRVARRPGRRRASSTARRGDAADRPRASSTSCCTRRIDPKRRLRACSRTGLNASPGAAVGKAVFDADTAEARGRAGEAVILVRSRPRPTTSTA